MKKHIEMFCPLVLAKIATSSTEPPAGVTPPLIDRATYSAFNLRADPLFLEFSVQAKRPVEIVVRTHDYSPGSSTGWHTPPGPVFNTVLKGKVTFYGFDDPTCTPKIVSTGEGYVDTSRGHIACNGSAAPAKDVTVIFAPGSHAFRAELPDVAAQRRFLAFRTTERGVTRKVRVRFFSGR